MKKLQKMLMIMMMLASSASLMTGCGATSSTAEMNSSSSAGREKSDAPAEIAPEASSGASDGVDMKDDAAEVESFSLDAEKAVKVDEHYIEDLLEGETEDSLVPDTEEPVVTDVTIEDDSQAFILTAGEWNDNENWGFFSNLISSGTIAFPSFGLNPLGRIAVSVEQDGAPVRNQAVALQTKDGDTLWQCYSDANGMAYLFYQPEYEGSELAIQVEGNAELYDFTVPTSSNEQGVVTSASHAELKVTAEQAPKKFEKTEVMFILDTTGSMGDEIAYLQKDFSAIAEETAGENISFSVNFYRDNGDKYVTKCNPFTNDMNEIQKKLNAEYADGGGDAPEAVAEILKETMMDAEWSADANKIAFLIFDAPPHDGNEEILYEAIRQAAAKGIHLVPVVASNADRETELFGRAAAIMTDANYVFLTDDSGVGGSHLEPIIGDYDVELLHDIIVRNIQETAQ